MYLERIRQAVEFNQCFRDSPRGLHFSFLFAVSSSNFRWPRVLGGLASIVYVALDSDAEFLSYGVFDQCVRQFMAVVSSVLIAGGSGFLTGIIMKKSETSSSTPDEYHDVSWWEAEYYEEDGAKSE